MSNNNEEKKWNITIGDGFRFGIGFAFAQLITFIIIFLLTLCTLINLGIIRPGII